MPPTSPSVLLCEFSLLAVRDGESGDQTSRIRLLRRGLGILDAENSYDAALSALRHGRGHGGDRT